MQAYWMDHKPFKLSHYILQIFYQIVYVIKENMFMRGFCTFLQTYYIPLQIGFKKEM